MTGPYDWEHPDRDFASHPAYAAQEEALREVFGTFDPRTILEVGPGTGRITRMALERWPFATYSAADIALAPLAEAHRLTGGLSHEYHGPIEAAGALSDWTFDLVIAVEVLMHVPPREVKRAVRNLVHAGAYLITCDWTQPLGDRPVRVQNFRHDYTKLYAGAEIVRAIPTGLQTIYAVRKAATA